MKKKYILILIILTIILSMISFFALKNTKASYIQSEQSIGTPVFKNVQINNIKTIKFIQPGFNTIVLQKNPIIPEKKSKANSPELKWTVQNLYNYPADTNKISDLLRELVDLKVIQNIHVTNTADYKELNLSPPSTAQPTATEVQFLGKSEKPLYSLLIGKRRFEMDVKSRKQVPIGRYIKISAQKNVILTDELFNETNFNTDNWLYKQDISIGNIKSIEQMKDSKTEWKLTRDIVNEAFKLKGTPKHTTLNKHNIKAITDSLNNLKFDSVAKPKLSSEKTGLNVPITLIVSTFNRIEYKLLIGKTHNQNRFVKLEITTPKNGTLKKKTQAQQNLLRKWTYLVNTNRTEPLLSSKGKLQKQKDKKRPHTGIYSMPIS